MNQIEKNENETIGRKKRQVEVGNGSLEDFSSNPTSRIRIRISERKERRVES